MLSIIDNKITLTAGDTANLKVGITDLSGNEQTLSTGDILTLTVRKSPVGDIILQKTNDTTELNCIDLVPSDTANIAPGSYIYDIDLVSGSDKFTVIPMNIFRIEASI